VRGEERISSAGRTFLDEIRRRSEVLVADRRLDADIARLVEYVDEPAGNS
jgi:histidine ammonia-lyase